MKVLFTLFETNLSGGARAIFEIANRLSRRNYDTAIVALGGNHAWHHLEVPIRYMKVKQSLNVLEQMRWQLHYMLKFRLKRKLDMLSTEGVARTFGFHSDLIRALAESIGDCDACVATWYPTALAVWISGKGKPYYFLQDFPELVNEASGPYGLRLFEKTLELPFFFLTNSQYTENLVLRHQNKANIKVVGVGIDEKMFYPRNSKASPSKSKEVMVILRGALYKGDDVAIKALNELNENFPIHATLLGSRNSLRIMCKFPYTLLSRVDDDILASLYSSADVFMFTSYVEGFGLPPLEAMACGAPVVTTDCKGNRDYAIDGCNCLMVPPGDHRGLAKAALKIMTDDDLARKLRAGGFQTAKNWTWEKVVDRFEEALRTRETNAQ